MLRTNLSKVLFAGAVFSIAAVSFAAPSAPRADKAAHKAVPAKLVIAANQPRNGVNADAGISSVGSHAPRQV